MARFAADGKALVHQRRQRNLPPVADRAEAVAVADAHPGEEHFVEVAATRHLLQRPHVDAGGLHVDDEHRQPLVLGDGGIGPRHDDAKVRQMGVGRPHLLPVDDPLVAVAHGLGADAGEVRPRRRLAEQLAPHLVAGERRGDVARDNLGRAVGEDGRDAHAQPDGEQLGWRMVTRLFLIEDDRCHRRQPLAAHRRRPRDAGVARRVLRLLPRARPRDPLGAQIGCRGRLAVLGGVDGEPVACLRAVGGVGGGICEVHECLPMPPRHCAVQGSAPAARPRTCGCRAMRRWPGCGGNRIGNRCPR